MCKVTLPFCMLPDPTLTHTERYILEVVAVFTEVKIYKTGLPHVDD